MATYPTTYVNKKDQIVAFPIPQRPLAESVKTNNLIFTADSGHETRRQKGSPKVTFEPTYPVMDQQAYDTLKTFFLARSGSVESFVWSHPVTKVAYTVRFDMDTLSGEYQFTNFNNHYYKCSVKLIQVF